MLHICLKSETFKYDFYPKKKVEHMFLFVFYVDLYQLCPLGLVRPSCP